MENERRQNVRYCLIGDTYAAIGRDYSKVGKITDISIGGLAFDYITGGQDTQKEEIIDIFLQDAHFDLYNMPCRVVYDIALDDHELKEQVAGLLTTRRCGVKFGQLSASTIKSLQAFIDSQPEA